VLFVVLVYLIYLEIHERRTPARQADPNRPPALDPAAGADPMSVDPVYATMPSEDDNFTLEDFPPSEPESGRGVKPFSPAVSRNGHARQNGSHRNGQSANLAYTFEKSPAVDPAQDAEEDDGLTIVPAADLDEEATYRLGVEVKPPLLGCLVRESDDPSVPMELPIYGVIRPDNEAHCLYIGRHSKHSALVIKNQHVSREHAVIVQRGSRLYLRDNASTAGTFVNWQRLRPDQEVLLRHNDHISLGPIGYRFQAADTGEGD
jgi:hypothetical protein